MKIAYAITSRNYLAQTKIAISSFLQFNPHFDVFVFNIDNEVYNTEAIWDNPKIRHEFVLTIDFENRDILRSKYNDFEFCNSIKPYLGCWLIEHFKETERKVELKSDHIMINDK